VFAENQLDRCAGERKELVLNQKKKSGGGGKSHDNVYEPGRKGGDAFIVGLFLTRECARRGIWCNNGATLEAGKARWYGQGGKKLPVSGAPAELMLLSVSAVSSRRSGRKRGSEEALGKLQYIS